MIYLSNNVMELCKNFSAGNYTKRGENIYFTAFEEKEDIFLCVKLKKIMDSSIEKFEILPVRINVSLVGEEEIIKNEENCNEKDFKYALKSFFGNLSYEEEISNIYAFENIYEILKKYVDKGFAYSEKNELFIDFMNMFQLKGKIIKGMYNLHFSEIRLINKSTDQTIRTFDDVSLCETLDGDDEDEEFLLEGFSSSLSENQIKELFERVS